MDESAISDLWWKNAVIYCLDVETYMDGNGDGIGDFVGLTERIGYLSGLGVTCLWLMPFFPSPGRDDGYDITDFYNVDPRLGTLGEFVELMRSARERGIRVIIDLVVNHTSVDHPWFQSARSDPDSPYRDWYVWSDQRPEEDGEVIFPDAEDSIWAWDEVARRYYLHRFYSEQPDLDVTNPAVMHEIQRIMGFWLELGVSGFRVDAVPYIIDGTAVEERMPEEPHTLLEGMRDFMSRRRGDAILVGEVNLPPGERETYFGDDGDEMTGLFNFILSAEIFRAVARGEARPVVDALEVTPVAPVAAQWMNFLRNHDELNLSKIPEEHKQEVMEAFGRDEGVQIFGRGIRRRTPPIVGKERLGLLMSLLLALPGTPVLWYGEEIGMGDNLSLPGRQAVRTPMQWSSGRNGGFSTADENDIVRPLAGGAFGVDQVSVAGQRRDPESLLNLTERAIRARKECPELGLSTGMVLETGSPAVLGLRCEWQGHSVITLHNFSGEEQKVSLSLDGDADAVALVDVLEDRPYDELSTEDPTFTLAPYGFRWLRPQAEDPLFVLP